MKIKRITSTPYHQGENGQAKSSNKVLKISLKKRLEAAQENRLNELLGVLWAHRTTIKSSTRKTSFSLIHGSKALIPVEVEELSLRCEHVTKETDNKTFSIQLDLLKGRKELALVRMVA